MALDKASRSGEPLAYVFWPACQRKRRGGGPRELTLGSLIGLGILNVATVAIGLGAAPRPMERGAFSMPAQPAAHRRGIRKAIESRMLGRSMPGVSRREAGAMAERSLIYLPLDWAAAHVSSVSESAL